MPITGYYEQDIAGDIQVKADLTGEVDMEWELDDNGDLMPRTASANPVFPAVGDVRPAGGVYGWASEYTGTLANLAATDAAYISLEAARNTDMAADKVEDAYAYLTLGVARVGTLTGGGGGTPPTSPTLVVEDNGDGTGATFTLSGEDAGTTNELFVGLMSDLSFISKGTSWTSSQKDVSLAPGLYLAYVKSTKSGVWSYSNIVRITVLSTSEAADDNLSLARRVMKQTAVLWEWKSTSSSGQPVYADPIEIKCRWTDKIQDTKNDKGETITSSSTLIVDRDIPERSIVMLCTLDAVTDAQNPLENSGAFEVVSVNKTPNIKAKKFLREVYV